MQEKLEQKILTTVTIPEKDVIWVVRDKEILIDGRLFDIRTFKILNGNIVVTGLFDDEETSLVNKHYDPDQDNQPDYSGMANLFKFLQFTADLPNAPEPGIPIKSVIEIPVDHNYFPTTYISILTPPPQI
jgi:hypothetical protein